MTQISRDDVLKLASLSSLSLSDDEIEALRGDIESILGYVEQLNELDTEHVEPAYQVTGLENVFREDIVDAGPVSREELLRLSPDQSQQQVKVPKV